MSTPLALLRKLSPRTRTAPGVDTLTWSKNSARAAALADAMSTGPHPGPADARPGPAAQAAA